jgi:hypothetical protein
MSWPVPSTEKRYPGRLGSFMSVNLTLSRDTVGHLRPHALHSKSRGKFLSSRLGEFDCRKLERLCELIQEDARRSDSA